MRSLERRRHQEDLLYHIVAYLVSLDKLLDDQAKLLREKISRAEQAEVTARMHQVRVAQAEARIATAISSEAVPMKASGGSKISACRNGPIVEHPFRPLEKHKSYWAHPL
jgi:hypothetical protein